MTADSLVTVAEGGYVVVDANFVGRGRYTAKQFRGLVERLSNRGHTVVVPEVVIWEWASHGHDALTKLDGALQDARNSVDATLGVGVPKITVPTVDELVERIAVELNAFDGVEIHELDHPAAVRALRQPLTQTGTGTRKNTVKTGAADAAVLDAVAVYVDSDELIVFASGDAVLCGEAKRDFPEVFIARTQHELWGWHGLIEEPPVETVAGDIAHFLEAELQEQVAGRPGPGLLEIGFRLSGDIQRSDEFSRYDAQQFDLVVTLVEYVKLVEAEIVSGDELPRLVVGKLVARVRADVIRWVLGPDMNLVDEYAQFDCDATVPVTVELDRDWKPTDFEVTDIAYFRLAQDEPPI